MKRTKFPTVLGLADEVEKVRLDDIQPSEANADIYNPPTDDRIEKLANDIKRNGLIEPLIITRDNIILSGHTRYKALRYLDRTFVKIRRAVITSDHPEFLKVLTSCNDQRDKTISEKLREIELDIDPLEYIQDVRRKRNEEPNELEKVVGELKSNRTLSDNYKHLHKAVKEIVDGVFKITIRGIFYKLLNNPPVESLHTGERFSNSKKSYDLLCSEVTKMRIKAMIPFEKIVDEKRKFNNYWKHPNMEYFISNQINRFLRGYDRDLLQSQERFVAIVCEKETLSYQINSANQEYDLPVLYTQGNSSLTVRYKLVKAAGDKPITLLFLTDLDPSGLKIQDSFVGSLEEDFDLLYELRAYRIALHKEHIEEYQLFSDQIAKMSDTSYKKFYERTGLTKAYELDAIDPEDMITLIDKSIRSVLDMDRFNEQLQIYKEDVEELTERRKRALESMII